MKKLLAAALVFLSGLASAQSQINVMYFFTPPAIAYLNGIGKSLATYGADMTTTTNAFLIGSSVDARVNTVGTINGNACCQGLTSLYSSEVLNIPGVMGWAMKSIPVNAMRDSTGADIVVVVGDYSDDVPALSMGRCSTGNGGPAKGFVGINVREQAAHPDMLSHEIGHQLCMEHNGWYRKTGTTPSDCEVRWTIEYGPGTDALESYPAYTCWKLSSGATACYTSGHAAIVSIAANNAPPLQSCTYSNGTLSGTTWSETMTCPGWGTAGFIAQQFSYPAFTCSNAAQVPYFAGSGAPPGYSGGTLVRNSVAVMNAQAVATAQFRNTKLAPTLIAQFLYVSLGPFAKH